MLPAFLTVPLITRNPTQCSPAEHRVPHPAADLKPPWFLTDWHRVEVPVEQKISEVLLHRPQLDGGGELTVGSIRQVEESSQLNCGETLGGTGLQDEPRGRCARGARISCSKYWILSMIPDPEHALAAFPILSLLTHAGHINVDAGRTRDVVAMD
ncbi:hypothetical protein NQZ68_020632 [Dissostichus eleginoides]|nr:hypothetical protein NQZ68_020632 [Dissostichus eleginoides]